MANATYNGIIYADTVGILSKVPVRVRAIQFVPNAVSDVLDLNFWDEGNAIATTEKVVQSVTITSTTTITDAGTTGVLNSVFADGAVLKIKGVSEGGGNGSTANHTYHLIATAGDNNVIVTAATLTNEATKRQAIIAYPARPFFNAKQPTATNTHASQFHFFGDSGFWLPNLVLEGVSTSAYALIYLV